ncbi:MAG: hypothetical protein NOF05_15435 [Candidatus Accumulibacter phosphatis]|nr:hypothetical protein [Candidatus Accumulibacter phosphatis]
MEVMQMPTAKTNPECVDVAAAARVHDQRIVALMWARAAVLGGCSFLAAGLWPPVSREIAINGLALSAFGLGLLWLLSNLGNQRVAIILCVGFALAGLSIGWNAWQRAQPGYIIEPLFTMQAGFLEALAEMNRQGGSGGWYGARLIGTVAGMVLAVEMLLLAWYLARSIGDTRGNFSPIRAGMRSRLLELALGAPRGLWPYVRSAGLSMLLLLLAMVLLAIAGTNMVAGMWFQSFQAQVDITDCVGFTNNALAECIAEKGEFARTGMTLQYVSAVVILPLLAYLFSLPGEYLAAKSAANRLASDQRAPLIFLRSFDDDQVTLKNWPRTILQLLMLPRWWRLNLDRMLLSEFMSWAPPRALGKPEEKDKASPFGALRKFSEPDPPGTPEEESHWRNDVRHYADTARLIVMVFDERILDGANGVSWEMQYIGNNPAILQKTVLLVSPKYAERRRQETADEHAARLAKLWRRAGEMSGFAVMQDTARAFACFPSQKLVFSGGRCSASEYLMALRASAHTFDPAAV